MRTWLLIGSLTLVGCGDSLPQEEADDVARVLSGSEMDRDELTDIRNICLAMIDCYSSAEDCPDETDLRTHMPEGTTSDLGRIMLSEFKTKGIRLMEEVFAEEIQRRSLHRANWPCREYHQQYNRRVRSNNRVP